MRFYFDRTKLENAEAVESEAPEGAKITCIKTGQSVELSKSKIVIGSRTGCHIKLKSESVAPLHCSFNLQNGTWTLVVLTRKSLTLLNNKEVNAAKLKSGDVIQIGEREFKFTD